MKCGFIGLGSQGGPMAQRMIDAGYDVTLWARRAETLEPYSGTAATLASSIGELAAQVDYCAICVVDDAGVEQVFAELLPGMKPGSNIVIHSTVHPDLCRSLAESAAQKNISLIDAPVSGGGPGAASGTLTVMVGGDKSAVEKARPVLQTFAGTIAHLGGVGTGQLAKLVNNSLMAANLALADHAINAARELGIEAEAFKDLVKVSSGRSFAFEVRARMASPTDFGHGARLLEKDLRLLGETLGSSADYAAIRDTAGGFLEQALNPADQ